MEQYDKKKIALHVRPGTPADYPTALEIQYKAYRAKEAVLYGPDIPPLFETSETLAKEISQGNTLLVGEYEGIIAATLRMKVKEDGSAYFGRLSVDPALQGMGIGKMMVNGFEKYNADAPAFVLSCGVDSEENRYLYSKLGYKETGESFHNPGNPKCMVMQKTNKRPDCERCHHTDKGE